MIYVVRHGKTDANLAGKLRGKAFDDPLNEIGIKQAQEAAEKLAGIKFTACYCSPMKRAVQTCKEIFKGTICFDDRMLPRNYAGIAETDAREAETNGLWSRGFNAEGLESVDAMERRIYEFFDEIKRLHRNENILVVTHQSVCRFAKAYAAGAQAGGDISAYITGNCEILEIDN